MTVAPARAATPPLGETGDRKTPRLIGWQGFTLHTPDGWDLTGFSGNAQAGYLRVDDNDEQGIEIKWATEPKGSKTAPDVSVRREVYFSSLKKTAKQKKLALETRTTEGFRPVSRPDRTTAGFTWTGDRKAIGAVWYCQTCRRVVIAQVLGARSGRGGLSGVAEAVLGSLRCHGDNTEWRTWALYDLQTQVPAHYELEAQQLMNVYLRLTFAHKTAKLTIEQWAMANVARRDAYLDVWLRANTKAEMVGARYEADETDLHTHPALRLHGGLALGMPLVRAFQQVGQLQRPATRFDAVAWECEPSNKLFLIQSLRPASAPDPTGEVAARTVCHVDAPPLAKAGRK